MYIIEIVPVLNDNYVYILHNEKDKLTAVIDPGDPKPVIKKLDEKKWKLDEIINTHHHSDHIAGNETLKSFYNCKLIAPFADKNRINEVTDFVSDNDTIKLAGFRTKVISTPGHTLGHVCYFLEDEKILFSGDTLFRLGCGRVFEGTMEQMKTSLDKLKKLPNETIIYCGHEYTLSNAKFCMKLLPSEVKLKEKYDEIMELRINNSSTIPFLLQEEKNLNPFLRCDNINFKKIIDHENKSSLDTFSYIRLQKDNF